MTREVKKQHVLASLFTDFVNSEKTGGFILLACTILSILISNSAAGDNWIAFWHHHTDLSFAGLNLGYSREHWVNDGLMAVFFLLVGLEIEREIYFGELSTWSKSILPVVAAIGGMIVPALIHFIFNSGTPTQPGVGIPMATDIAFALGMLSLLGNRVSVGLKIFLTAFAIIDDLGAIIVIAIFYTKEISFLYLGTAMGIFVLLLVFNRLKIHKLVFYLVPGVVMWYCMLQSGIHATLSGVLLAFAIPFSTNDDQTNPSWKVQHFLHKPVAFLILPVFALANTALVFGETWFEDLSTNNSLGIILGLFAGKVIGIATFSFLLVKSGAGQLPDNVNWRQMIGVGFLGGIGFTMSIFISNLAFTDQAYVEVSKIAILAGSLISVIVGLLILRKSKASAISVRDQSAISVQG